MARKVLSRQFHFAGGEIGPMVLGRDDLERYQSSVEEMTNWLPKLQGGATRFYGSQYVSAIGADGRLEGFELSEADKYLFLFANERLVIYKDDAFHQELVTPWGTADLFELDYAQALDTIVVVHEDYAPRRIYRDADDIFYIEDLSDTDNDVYIKNIPLDLPVVLEARPTTFYPEGYYVLAPPSGGADDYYYEVTRQGVTDDGISVGDSDISLTIGVETTSGTCKFTNRGLRSDKYVWSTTLGWPRTVAFFEDRLVFGGSKTYPNRLWLSATGDYFNFYLGSASAGDAIDAGELLSDQFEGIIWLYGGRSLLVGTTESEWATVQQGAATPANFAIRRQSAIGSKRARPIDIDGAVMFLTSDGGQVREMVYTDKENAYYPGLITSMNPDIISNATQMAVKASYSDDGANLLFVLNDTGTLAVFNTLRGEGVSAWCKRTFSGTVQGITSVGDDIYCIAAIAGTDVYADGVYEDDVYADDGDDTWALLKLNTSFTVDYGETSTTTADNLTFTGFDHLVGQSVQVIADGAYVGTQTVASGGAITVTESATTVTAGLALPTPTIKTLPEAFGGVNGNIALSKKRKIRALMLLHSTQGITIDGYAVPIREAGDTANAAVDAFSGVKSIRLKGWDYRPQITLTAPDPVSTTVLGMTVEVGY